MKRAMCVVCIVVVAIAGCVRVQEKDAGHVTFRDEEAEVMVVVGVDLSGSFVEKMMDGGLAHQFLTHVLNNYFSSSLGGSNRVVIVQLSATNRPILWDGTPQEMRQDFPSPDALNRFLRKNSHPDGSRIYDGIADSMEYMMTDHGFSTGQTKGVLIVLSDFEDTTIDSAKGEQRLVNSLREFGRKKGATGFYYLSPPLLKTWREHLQQSGVKNWICESGVRVRPPLPNFD